MPRTFPNRASVLAVTSAEYEAMSPDDRAAFDAAWLREACAQFRSDYRADLARDATRVGLDRREDTGW